MGGRSVYLALVLLTAARCHDACDPLLPGERLVETNMGPVKGQLQSYNDPRLGGRLVNWVQYLGVPYAEPPVGNKRFLPPNPITTPWECPPDITPPLPICPQLVGLSLDPRSSEDCLQLNVYVPDELNTTSSNQLPVMVYIHGGGWVSGDGTPSSFGPQYLMSHGVIIVGINYRLGPLGFLSLGTPEVPGNMGMKDQVMALTWVQDNINRFGGDPEQVTIFGQSAGSMSVTYHLFSPMTEGLFNRVIAQSGMGGFTPSLHHFQQDKAAKYGAHSATLMGCDEEEVWLGCLQTKSAQQIMMLDTAMEGMTAPVIDSGLAEIPYLEINPLDAVQQGLYHKDVDLMIGVNKDEALLFLEYFIQAPDLFEVLANTWDAMGPRSLFQIHHTESTATDVELATYILDFYTQGEGLEGLRPERFTNVTDMYTDSFFWFGVDMFLDLHLPQAIGNTFEYFFSYWGEYHRVHAPGLAMEDCPGVTHSDELYFFWNPYYGVSYPLNKEDQAMSLSLTTMWTNFAKNGHPTPPELSEGGIEWSPLSPTQRKYLRIDEVNEMELAENYVERVEFWKTLDISILLN